MIVDVPILYRAVVVRARCRTPEDVLLRGWTPVSIPEGEPDAAIRITETSLSLPQETIWYGDGGRLLGDARRIRSDLLLIASDQHKYGNAVPDPRFSGLPDSIRNAVQQTALMQNCSIGDPYLDPFVSRDAIRMGVLDQGDRYQSWDSYPKVMEEDAAFRAVQQVRLDGRDIAIAHARAVARSMMIHRESGVLLVPTSGPYLWALPEGVKVLAELSPRNTAIHLYRVTEFDEAVKTASRLCYDRAAEIRIPQIQVIQPDLLQEQAAPEAISLVTAAKVMCDQARNMLPREQHVAMGVLHGHDSLRDLETLTSAILKQRMAPDMEPVAFWSFEGFPDVRAPTELQLATSEDMVMAGVQLMREARPRVYGTPMGPIGISFHPGTMEALEGLVHRAERYLPDRPNEPLPALGR